MLYWTYGALLEHGAILDTWGSILNIWGCIGHMGLYWTHQAILDWWGCIGHGCIGHMCLIEPQGDDDPNCIFLCLPLHKNKLCR